MNANKRDAIVASFKQENIPTFAPGDPVFELAVANPNLLYRFSRPGLVVQPETILHVQYIVTQAKQQGIRITIKNGGHSYAGFSSTDTGILLDLANLLKTEQVKLDMKSKTVTLSGGARWGHAYRALLNDRLDGYVINGGRCPLVGVSGFTLGGGLGPFTRTFGMGIDSLKEVTMVTAAGEVVTVNDKDAPNSKKGQLFWALRGGGGGNFGVVVKLKTSLQQLNDTVVVSGRYNWFPASTKAMEDRMTTMKSFYSIDWPTDLTIDTSWVCDLEKKDSVFGIRYLIYHNGNKSDFDKVIDACLDSDTDLELGKQLKKRSMQEKSTRFFHETLISQWFEESAKSFPGRNTKYTIYTSFVFQNNRKKMAAIVSIIKEEMQAFRDRFSEENDVKGLLQVTFIHSGGKASQKQRSDTAFRWRDGDYHAYIMIEWEDKWLEGEMRDFCRAFKKRLREFSMSNTAAFINFADRQMTRSTYVKAYYGNNSRKLQRIKQAWDPDNYFRFTQSIPLPDPSTKKNKGVAFGAFSARSAVMTASNSVPMTVGFGVDGTDSEEEGDGGLEGEGSEVDEANGVDAIATEQWESYIPPPARDALLLQPYLSSYLSF